MLGQVLLVQELAMHRDGAAIDDADASKRVLQRISLEEVRRGGHLFATKSSQWDISSAEIGSGFLGLDLSMSYQVECFHCFTI